MVTGQTSQWSDSLLLRRPRTLRRSGPAACVIIAAILLGLLPGCSKKEAPLRPSAASTAVPTAQAPPPIAPQAGSSPQASQPAPLQASPSSPAPPSAPAAPQTGPVRVFALDDASQPAPAQSVPVPAPVPAQQPRPPSEDAKAVRLKETISKANKLSQFFGDKADDYKLAAETYDARGEIGAAYASSVQSVEASKQCLAYLEVRDQAGYDLGVYLVARGDRKGGVMYLRRVLDSQTEMNPLGKAARARLEEIGEL